MLIPPATAITSNRLFRLTLEQGHKDADRFSSLLRGGTNVVKDVAELFLIEKRTQWRTVTLNKLLGSF